MGLSDLLKERGSLRSSESLSKIRNKVEPFSIIPYLAEYAEKLNFEDDGRAKGVFHPSEISKEHFCPRAWCIAHKYEHLVEKRIPMTLRITFDIGHYLHAMMQKYLSQTGLLWGKYRCQVCNTLIKGFLGYMTKCCSCGENDWEYIEPRIDNEEWNIHGRTDGILIPPEMNRKYVFEFKTSNSRTYTGLKESMGAHKNQASIYMWCLEQDRIDNLRLLYEEREVLKSGRGEFSEDTQLIMNMLEENIQYHEMPFKGMVVLYLNKENSSQKEFFIPYDSDVDGYMKKTLFPKLVECKKYLATGELPKRICKNEAECKLYYCNLNCLKNAELFV